MKINHQATILSEALGVKKERERVLISAMEYFAGECNDILSVFLENIIDACQDEQEIAWAMFYVGHKLGKEGVVAIK